MIVILYAKPSEFIKFSNREINQFVGYPKPDLIGTATGHDLEIRIDSNDDAVTIKPNPNEPYSVIVYKTPERSVI